MFRPNLIVNKSFGSHLEVVGKRPGRENLGNHLPQLAEDVLLLPLLRTDLKRALPRFFL